MSVTPQWKIKTTWPITLKGLINNTIGAPLKPYEEQELLVSKKYGIPSTTYALTHHIGYHNVSA